MKRIAFLFPGQGSQSVGMGQDIYQEFDLVREIFDMASEIAKINLSKLCFKGPMEELTQTVNLQPAITAVNLGMLSILEKESLFGEMSLNEDPLLPWLYFEHHSQRFRQFVASLGPGPGGRISRVARVELLRGNFSASGR